MRPNDLETCDTRTTSRPKRTRLHPLLFIVLFVTTFYLLVGPGASRSVAQNSLTDTQLLQIKYDQKPGSQVSPDLVFRDETGKQVRLGDYFGKRPIVLIPGYYSCPMLCSIVMNGVIESFRDLRWTAGEQFDVIFVSIDPREGPALAAAKKKLYLRDYGREGSDDGWHFLVAASQVGTPRLASGAATAVRAASSGATNVVGRSTALNSASPTAGDAAAQRPYQDATIQTLADEIGFHYAYDAGLKQFAHPAGFVVLTPGGKVAHYFFGVTFSAKEVDIALRHASARKTDSPVRDFILLCCEYSPLRGKYGNVIMDTIRIGGVGMVAALGIYFIRPARKPTRGLK